MHHRHGASGGGRHHVDHLVGLRELLLEHDHRERRRAGGDVARAWQHGVGGRHACSGVALWRAEHGAGLEVTRDVEPRGAFGRERAGLLAGHEDARQDVCELPRIVARSHEGVELVDHLLRVASLGGVDGEHTGGVAHAEHLLARELPVDVSGERREVCDLRDVGLVIEDCLIEVGDAPAQGYVEDEELRELLGGTGRVGVAPGAEGHEYGAVGAEGHIAVHHGADADGRQTLDLHVVVGAHVVAQTCVAVLEAIPDGLGAVGPEPVDELVFPLV